MKRGYLKIELLSETTFGSSNHVGQQVDTDADYDPLTGLPHINGKRVKGLLHDTWESMKHAYAGNKGAEQATVRLFGRAGSQRSQAVLHFGTAYLSSSLEQKIKQKVEKRELQPLRVLAALGHIRSQTAIERKSGAALENSLRTSRVLHRGLTFYAPLTWLEEPANDDVKWLECLCKLTRHAGLGRTRGRGHVHISYHPAPDRMASNSKISEPQRSVSYLPFRLMLKAPLLTGQPGGNPNSAEGMEYIPGSLIRGLVASRGDPNDIVDLVLSEQVCYLNAYPQAGTWGRSFPTPKTWRRLKESQEVEGKRIDLINLSDGGWPMGPLLEFGYPFHNGADLYKPHMQTRLHHQRDPIRGRPSEGGIFAYEALASRQVFIGMIQFKPTSPKNTQALAHRVGALLNSPLTLGRSRLSEYGGLAELEFGIPQARESNKTCVPEEGDTFMCRLLSPYVGFSKTGQPEPSSLLGELEEQLDVTVIQTFWSFRIIGGYNSTWRNQTPQMLAVEGGSVVILKAKRDLTEEDLQTLEHAGFGERKQEGFGRVVFETLDTLDEVSVQPTYFTDPTGLDLGDGTEARRVLQKGLLRDALSEAMALLELKGGPIPNASLLGRIRASLKDGEERSALENYNHTLKNLKSKAGGKLRRCWLSEYGPLLDLLTALGSNDWYEKAQSLLRLNDVLDQNRLLDELDGTWLRKTFPELQHQLIFSVLSLLISMGKDKT